MKKYNCARPCGFVNPDNHAYTRYNEGDVITATVYNNLTRQLQGCFERALTDKQQAKMQRDLDNLLAACR